MKDRFKFRALIEDYDQGIYDKPFLADVENIFYYPRLAITYNSGMRSESFKLMQSSGLTDKNGKLIYEGDIIVPYYVNPFGELTNELDNDKKGVVVFQNGVFALNRFEKNNINLLFFVPQKIGKYISNYGNLIIFEKYCNLEIIGNIYETPID